MPKIIEEFLAKNDITRIFPFETIYQSSLSIFPLHCFDKADQKLNLNSFLDFVEDVHKSYPTAHNIKIEKNGGSSWTNINREIALVILPLSIKTMKFLPHSNYIVDWEDYDDSFTVAGNYSIIVLQKHVKKISATNSMFEGESFAAMILRNLASAVGLGYCTDYDCVMVKDWKSYFCDFCSDCLDKLKELSN